MWCLWCWDVGIRSLLRFAANVRKHSELDLPVITCPNLLHHTSNVNAKHTCVPPHTHSLHMHILHTSYLLHSYPPTHPPMHTHTHTYRHTYRMWLVVQYHQVSVAHVESWQVLTSILCIKYILVDHKCCPLCISSTTPAYVYECVWACMYMHILNVCVRMGHYSASKYENLVLMQFWNILLTYHCDYMQLFVSQQLPNSATTA